MTLFVPNAQKSRQKYIKTGVRKLNYDYLKYSELKFSAYIAIGTITISALMLILLGVMHTML